MQRWTIPCFSARRAADMAKKKQALKTPVGDGQVKEQLTNKAEAIRRALAKLGNEAKPLDIQDFIKRNFDVEMTTNAISVYKYKLVKNKGKLGRKPRVVGATAEPAPKPAMHEAVSFKDMRTVKEIRNRLGPARMRELVALMA